MENQLVTYILQRAKQDNLSFRELAAMADMSHNHVTKILNGERNVTWKFCVNMADALNKPEWEFLIMGGIIKSIPDEVMQQEQVRLLVEIFSDLPPEKQQEVLNFARYQKAAP